MASAGRRQRQGAGARRALVLQTAFKNNLVLIKVVNIVWCDLDILEKRTYTTDYIWSVGLTYNPWFGLASVWVFTIPSLWGFHVVGVSDLDSDYPCHLIQ